MLKDFQEKNEQKQKNMDEKLEKLKLENVRSMWYFVSSSGKKAIAGSKG